MGYDEASKRMQVLSLHPGVTLEQVRAATGFELEVADSAGCDSRSQRKRTAHPPRRSRSAPVYPGAWMLIKGTPAIKRPARSGTASADLTGARSPAYRMPGACDFM